MMALMFGPFCRFHHLITSAPPEDEHGTEALLLQTVTQVGVLRSCDRSSLEREFLSIRVIYKRWRSCEWSCCFNATYMATKDEDCPEKVYSSNQRVHSETHLQ